MVMSSTVTLIVIAVLSLVIGIILGVFATLLWVDYIRKDKTIQKENDMNLRETSPAAIAQEGDGVVLEQIDVEEGEKRDISGFREVVRFGYVNEENHLAIQMDSQICRDPDSLPEDRASHLRFYIAALNNWIGIRERQPIPMSVTDSSDITIQIRPNKKGKKSSQRNESVNREVKQSIAFQVNEILQKMLLEESEIKQKISLEEGKDGNLLVHIDNESFPDIESIPYPEIKAFIQKATETWNNRGKHTR